MLDQLEEGNQQDCEVIAMKRRWRDRRLLYLVVGIVIGAVGLLVLGMAYERSFTNGIQIERADWHGIAIMDTAWAGLAVYHSGYDGVEVLEAGRHGLHIHSAENDYIQAGSDEDIDFRVANDGAAYSDGGWRGWADFAELIAVEGAPSMYEPGDVLVISAALDRAVVLSSERYSTSVIGVYSLKPGFLGSSHVMEEQREDEVPVAIVGIVPCKVSAENGAIVRGDLLTTSETPGHAMKATEEQVGAILGKALGALDTGKGVIEVLLTLQ